MQNVLIAILAFVLMEPFTYCAHRWVMHGLAKFLHGESRAELTVEMIPIRQLNVTQYPLAHFAGTTKFSILPKDVGVLAKYVNEGGTLVIESIGGSADFSASARELIKTIFPDGVPVLHQLPADHPMIQSPYAQGFKLKDEIEFRKYSNIKHGRRETNAQIFAAYIDDRPAVLLSDFDITSGLLGTNTWGIDGYSPETSLKLAANLVIWAADNNPRPRLPQRQPVINH